MTKQANGLTAAAIKNLISTTNDVVARKLNIVYDMTLCCVFACSCCCLSASPAPDTLRGELPFKRKLALANDIAELKKLGWDVSVDFSGGELMTNADENLQAIERVSQVLGRDKIGLSISGYSITDETARRIAAIASEAELTLDNLPGQHYALRPDNYAVTADRAIPHLLRHGVTTAAQTVVARSNSSHDHLRALYNYMREKGVSKWSLHPFYPSGRGAAPRFANERLTRDELGEVVRFVRSLQPSPDDRNPVVEFSYQMPGHERSSDICRCVRKSIGILPNGLVVACFWATRDGRTVTDSKFLLGDLRTSSLAEILQGEKARYWTCCEHHCELCQ